MPPKRKAAKVQSSGGSDDEEYRMKRDRNNQVSYRYAYHQLPNHFFALKIVDLIRFFCPELCMKLQAVKRSRVKSKQRAEETNVRVQELKDKNGVLENNIETAQKELRFLKDLFLSQAAAKSEILAGIDLKKLLSDDYEEGGSGSGSGSSASKQSSTKS